MAINSLNISRHLWPSQMVVLFCVLIFLPVGAFAAEDAKERLDYFLENDMAFSKKEFSSFKEGKTVTKVLETDPKHEVGIFSIARINVSKDFFLRNYSCIFDLFRSNRMHLCCKNSASATKG